MSETKTKTKGKRFYRVLADPSAGDRWFLDEPSTEAGAAIQLGPTIPDLHYLALCDRRKQLEEMGRDDNEEDADDANSADTDRQTPDKAEDFAPTDRLTKLRREMENAIATEDYEGAAKLRDEINRLQTEDGRDE